MYRITNNMLTSQAILNINKRLFEHMKLTQQISTGRRINKVSDDPSGYVKSVRLEDRNRYYEDIESAFVNIRNLIRNYDQTLRSISNVSHRIRELAVHAANGTNNQHDRHALVSELEEIEKTLALFGNTKIDGKYIFGGYDADSPPVIQNPDGSYEITNSDDARKRIKLKIGDLEIEYGMTVYDIYRMKSGESIFGLLKRLRNSILVNDVDAIERDIGALDEINSKISDEIVKVGYIEDLMDSLEKRFSELKELNIKSIAEITDTDITKASTELSKNQVILQAAYTITSRILPQSLVNFLR